MKQTIIIADDLTGALDAVAPYASPEISVSVQLGEDAASNRRHPDVLSTCVETRHLIPAAAYEAVHSSFAAAADGAQILFKKTDSALRGNVGAELEALLDASGAKVVHFIPAFPCMGRTTVNGVHLVDGVPVAESAFGSDPLNPVTCSRVADVIAATSSTSVLEVSVGAPLPADFSGIAVYDALTQEDVDARASEILALDGPLALAGCSGLSRALASAQGVACTDAISGRASDLMVMCGSGNPASRAQCAAARAVAPTLDVPLAAMTNPAWLSGAEACAFVRDAMRAADSCAPLMLVDASSPVPASVADDLGIDNDTLRARISNQLGDLFARLIRDTQPSAAMVMGGDALLACLRALNISALAPFAEPAPGVVAAYADVDGRNMVIISKSGGFGDPQLFCDLAEHLSGHPVATAQRLAS